MLGQYFRQLYQRTMQEAYGLAGREIGAALREGGSCLDCGASEGAWQEQLAHTIQLPSTRYYGVEWSPRCVAEAQTKGLNVVQGDLNKPLPYPDQMFRCVFGLSVLEHLLYPCAYLRECYRTLESGGKLVILTPNISTYFTAALILAGKMPSSGPHPDSNFLLESEELYRVRTHNGVLDTEAEAPEHRHLVVFSYRVLEKYLQQLGFRQVQGHGFGVYPFPNFLQPLLEKIDPWHCHQMVFVATK